MKNPKKNPAEVKKANSFVFVLLRLVFVPALYLLFRFKFEMASTRGIKRPCLILANHQTVFDQFALAMGFKFGVNFIASDTIFRHGLLSWLMKVIARPIPFSKGNSDLIAVKNMVSVVKDGGAVAMFPSGNRSFYGNECKIVPGTGKLAKKLNVPLVLVQMRGGYHTLPRWKKGTNKGKMRAVVSRVVSPEELSAMSCEEIDGVISQELCFDDFEFNRKARIEFRGKHKTEYLESVLFYCPQCGGMNNLYSEGNRFYCRDCGAIIEIDKNGFFVKIDKADKIPETILDWSVKQLDFIKNFDFSGFSDKPVFSDDNVVFCRAERAKKEEPLGTGLIELYNDRLVVCGQEFLLSETTMAIIGVRKMTLFTKNSVYALIAPFRLNFIKYMICGYYLRNKILDRKDTYYGY